MAAPPVQSCNRCTARARVPAFKEHTMIWTSARAAACGLLGVALAGPALFAPAAAAPVFYFAENKTANRTVTGSPVLARERFLGDVYSPLFSNGNFGSSSHLVFGADESNPSLVAGQISGVVQRSSSPSGTFNTSGAPGAFYERLAGEVASLVFFDPITALGMYFTDMGHTGDPEVGKFVIDLVDTDGIATRYVVPHARDASNGSLVFWGFADTQKRYRAMNLFNLVPVDGPGGNDVVGLDDLILASALPPETTGGSVPEPHGLALAGIALLALWPASRRRRAA
jgi:hypothetical protein